MTKLTGWGAAVVGSLLLVSAAWVTACSGSRDEPPTTRIAARRDAVSLHGTPAPNGSTVDTNWEYEMTSGRRSKLPVSYLWSGRFTVTGTRSCTIGGNNVRIRARCLSKGAPADECDPGLVVARRDTTGAPALLDVSYNADDPNASPDAALSFSVCSPQRHEYDVIAYSELRGTSHVAVEHSVDNGPWVDTFTSLTTGAAQIAGDVHAGGALVKVGPMASRDALAVHSAGTCETNTRMVVFNRSGTLYDFFDPVSASECDPRFVATQAWSSGDVYAVIGLDGPSPREKVVDKESHLDYERYVDLVHSSERPTGESDAPLGPCTIPTKGAAHSRPKCSGDLQTIQEPGKYMFSVMAGAGTYAVGDTPDWDGKDWSGDETGYTCNDNARGVGNDLAFHMTLLQDGVPVRERWVPRGALGGAPSVTNRVAIDHTVPADGLIHTYAIAIDAIGPYVLFDSSWTYAKLRDPVEVKLATLNIEYGEGMQIPAEMKNAVDLLGRSTDSNQSGLPRVASKDNRGRFRWDADVLSFNEITADTASYGLMSSRLNAASSLAWSGVRHRQKDGGAGPRDGLVFVNERTVNAQGVSYASSDIGGGFYVPLAQAAARRITSSGGYEDRPFMVYNTYLQHDDDPGDGIGDRENQYEMLIANIVDYHLVERPFAFNTSGSSSPEDAGNRFVILGDLNMRNHQCAESNRFVRKLRERFGYALDASMAITDAQDRTDLSLPGVQYRTFDLHYNGLGITDPLVGFYGDCDASRHVLVQPGIGPTGCTYGWETFTHWEAAGTPYDVDRNYMWWAAPSSLHGGAGSRLDTIILVGRGWADDDPVREYAVMQNMPKSTPLFSDDAAVEIRRYCNEDSDYPGAATERICAGDQSCAETSRSYSPEFPVCDKEVVDVSHLAGAGHTAVRTDHKPVGVRLRMLMNR